MLKLFKYSWPAAIIAVIIFYLSCLVPDDGMPKVRFLHADKVVHFLMYFGLSLIASCYYIYRKAGDVKKIKLLVFAILLPIIYGGIIEILQDRYFNRSGDWFDLLADMAGSLAAIPCAIIFKKMIVKYNNRNK